jgi:hypothetical protein
MERRSASRLYTRYFYITTRALHHHTNVAGRNNHTSHFAPGAGVFHGDLIADLTGRHGRTACFYQDGTAFRFYLDEVAPGDGLGRRQYRGGQQRSFLTGLRVSMPTKPSRSW